MSSTRRRDGHGFGLFSIVERLRQLGGEMHLASGAGRGTRIRLELAATGADS